MLTSNEELSDQIARLRMTVGYPRDVESLTILRDGLDRACERFGVYPENVIDAHLRDIRQIRQGDDRPRGAFCPTEADFFQIADSLRIESSYRQESAVPSKPRGCERCNGTGWERVFALYTMEGYGEFSYKRREWITQGVHDSLQGRLGINQTRHTGVKRCDHAPIEPPWTEQARAEHDAKWERFINDPNNTKLIGPMISNRLKNPSRNTVDIIKKIDEGYQL